MAVIELTKSAVALCDSNIIDTSILVWDQAFALFYIYMVLQVRFFMIWPIINPPPVRKFSEYSLKAHNNLLMENAKI